MIRKTRLLYVLALFLVVSLFSVALVGVLPTLAGPLFDPSATQNPKFAPPTDTPVGAQPTDTLVPPGNTMSAPIPIPALPATKSPTPQLGHKPGVPSQAQSSITVINLNAKGALPSSNIAILNDGTKATITVTVRDDSAIPLAGQAVNVIIMNAPKKFPVGMSISPLNGTTNAAGQFIVTVSSIANPALLPFLTFAAYIPNGNVTLNSPPASINFAQSIAVNFSSSVPPPIPGDGVTEGTVVLTYTDSSNIGVPGLSVTFTPGVSGVIFDPGTPPTQLTDANGQVTYKLAYFNGMFPANADIIFTTNQVQSVPPQMVHVFFSPPPADPNRSTINTNTTTVFADNLQFAIVTVVVKDLAGHPLVGRTVSINTSGLTVNVTPESGNLTDTLGTVKFDIRSSNQNIGTVLVSATSGTTTILNAGSPLAINFVKAPPTEANSSVSPVTPPPVSVPADGTTTQLLQVIARDDANNTLSGRAVQLSVDNPIGITGLGSTTTNGAGVASFTVTSVNVANVVFKFTVDGIPFNTKTIQVNFTQAPPDPAQSTITLLSCCNTIPGDNTQAVTIRVTLKDKGGHPVPGVQANISVNPGSAPVTFSPLNPPPVSGAAGTVDFIAKGDASQGQFSVTFTGSFGPGNTLITSGSVPVTFLLPPADRNNSTIVINTFLPSPPNTPKSSIQANGVDTTTILVTIKDAGGQTILGKQVALNPTVSGVVTTNGIKINGNPANAQVPVTTGANGQALFTISGTTLYPSGVTFGAVTVNDVPNVTLSSSVVIFFTTAPADPTKSKVISVIPASPPGVPANGSSQITYTFQLFDAGGNFAASKLLNFRTANGVNPPVPGVAIVPNAGNPAVGVNATDGTGTVQFKVSSTIAQANVTFFVDDMTDGIMNFTFTTAIPTSNFTGSGGTVYAPNSTIQVAQSVVTVPGPVQVIVTLRDTGNTPIVGRPSSDVTLSTTGFQPFPPGVSYTTNAAPSDNAGRIFFSLSSTGSTPVFTLIGIEQADGQIIQNPPAGGSATVQFILPPQTPTSTGTITSTFTSSPGPSPTNTFTSSPGPSPTNTFTPGPGSTATFTFTPGPGSTATFTPGPGSTATFTPTPPGGIGPSPVTSTINVYPSSVPANGFSPANIIVIVRNSTGTVIPGQFVTLNTYPSPLPSGVTLNSSSGVTAFDGSVVFQIQSSIATTISFTATASGVVISQPPSGGSTSVTFTPPVNPNSISSTNSSINPSFATVIADGVQFVNVTVTVRNVNNTTIQGAQVTLFGGNGVSASPSGTQMTDSSGNATFQLRSTIIQTATISAQASNLYGTVTLTQTATINFVSSTGATITPGPGTGTPGTGAVGANSSVTADFLSIPADNTTIATITVTLRNSSNVGVSGKNIVVTPSQVLAGVTLTALNSVTDASGVAKFTVKSSVQGSITFSASDTSDSPTIFITQTVTITFTAPGTAAVPAPNQTPGAGTPGVNLLPVPTGPVIGTVRAFRLRVRTGPGLDFDILGLLAFRTRILILAKNCRGTWYNIQLADRTAWVFAGLVRVTRADFNRLPSICTDTGSLTAPVLIPVAPVLIPEVGQGIGVINTNVLHTRTGPGLNYPQVGDLTFGTEVLILGRSADRLWYEIKVQSGPVWVYSFFVRVTHMDGEVFAVIPAPPAPH